MATGPQIVHKQFNSPIGLYSQQNIKETLNKHMSNLDNGTVGIDFNNPSTDKPANLANSAVLRMLEEEERNRRGYPSQKKVVWPPAPETNGYHQPQQQNNVQHSPSAQQPQQYQQPQYQPPPPQPQAQPQYQQPQYQQPQYQQPQYQEPQYQPPQPQYQQPQYQQPQYQQPQYQQPQYQQPQYQQPQYQQPQYQEPQYQPQYQQPQYQQPQYQQPPNQPQYQQPQYQEPQYQQPQQAPPAHCEGRRQEPTGLSKLIPVGPGVTAAPVPAPAPAPAPQSPYQPGPPSPGIAPQPYRQQSSRWAPVSAPLSPQTQNSQPSYGQPQLSPSQGSQQYSPQPPYSPQSYSEPQKAFEPPPSTITLRPQPPIHQKPSPVFPSQPATASLKGGVNMRGDQKWPPQSVKEAVAAENEARRLLAKGPACRPRKVHKDYRAFFAQHALSHNYPGYRVPPGTQHYDDQSGRSSY